MSARKYIFQKSGENMPILLFLGIRLSKVYKPTVPFVCSEIEIMYFCGRKNDLFKIAFRRSIYGSNVILAINF